MNSSAEETHFLLDMFDRMMDDAMIKSQRRDTDEGNAEPVSDVDGLLGTLVDQLSPTARFVYERLIETEPALTTRLSGRANALVVVETPLGSWNGPFKDACERYLPAQFRQANHRIHFFELSKPRFRTDEEFDESALLPLLHYTIVVIPTADVPIPPIFTALADLVVKIPALSGSDLTEMVARRYPGSTTAWPDEVDPAGIPPSRIDLVLARAATADDAVRILTLPSADTPDIKRTATRTPMPSFATLEGYGAAKNWGLQLLTDVSAYRRGELAWTDVDAGALLTGPPGTGKTLFAASLAQAFEGSFVAASYSAWQSAGTGHLGNLTKAMRQSFVDAAKNLPALLFIDEIDTFQRRGGRSDADGWWTAVTNALLEQLDGISRRDGLVVVAACNSIDRMDPALLRAGRLDRIFEIQLPDERALAAILASHLGGEASSEEIQPVAVALAGSTSGADAARIARDARRIARTAQRAVTTADLVTVALPPDTRSSAVQWRTAVHEAGHAVVSMALGITPFCLSLLVTGSTGGHVSVPRDPRESRYRDFATFLVPVFAGRAAEDLLLGEPSANAGGAPSSDLGIATSVLGQLDAEFGLGSRLSIGGQADRPSVEGRMRRLDAEARFLVWKHREAILILARRGLVQRVLGRQALTQFAAEFGFHATITTDNEGTPQ